MAITWGAAVSDATNAFRIGYEFSQSPSTVANSTTSVTVTLKIYLGTKYNAYDSGASWGISGNISSSGSTSFNHTSGTAWSSSNVTLLATRTRTVTPSFSGTVATSITATVTGLAAIAGTASVSGTWTTAKRPIIAPDAPSNLSGSGITDSQVTLSWTNNNPGDASAPYSNIEVDSYDYDTGVWTNIGRLGVVTSWTATGASANKKYAYRVRATNSAGASGYSNYYYLTTTPAAPSGVQNTRSGNDIVVNWTDNAPFNDLFDILHSSDGGTTWDANPIATVDNSTDTWTHTTPTTNQKHAYKVRARISSGNGILASAYSAPSPGIQLTDNPPGAVTSVTPATSTITIPNPQLGLTMAAISTGQTQKGQWQFATDTNFTANVKTITEADADLRSSGATTESPTLTQLALTNGTWYMRARALDVNGVVGPWSASSTLTVNTPVPATPTAVSATNLTSMYPTLNATQAVDAQGRSVKAEWTIATNSGFTAGVVTVIEPDSDYRASGAAAEVLDITNRLTVNGTYYLRARTRTPEGALSAWSGTVTFTLALPLPTAPTVITPENGSTVSTNFPTLGATLAALSENRTLAAEWQVASDSGFTANVKTITEPPSDDRLSGATTEPFPTAAKLSQGTWYMRARGIDQFGNAGPYAATTTFIVQHKPSATPTSPANDATQVWGLTTFAWTFSDPEKTDTQSAFQVIIERNDTGAVLYDSGKVQSYATTLGVGTAPLLKDVRLRWKVQVWDSDNVSGGYSPYALFTLSDVPAVTITSPTANQQIGTGKPTVTWTTDAQTVQANFRIVITRNSDGVTIVDTNTISTSAQTWTASGNILENTIAYTVNVTVTDTVGLKGSASQSFTTAYQAPASVNYTTDASTYEDNGYIAIDWSATAPDGFFTEWDVYRRKTGEMDWERLATFTDSSTTSYFDWTATAGDAWEYAVTQSAGRSGIVLESVINPTPDSNLAAGTHYWLINPYDASNNLKLDLITSDSFTDEYEEAELLIIGRGRKVNLGTRFGYNGTLNAQVRDTNNETARSKRIRLQQIKAAQVAYYLRTPFGDLFEVSLSNLQFDRVAGVGTSEYVNVTIPYKEVS